MNYQEIELVTDARQIIWLTLNRPEKHNAMSAQMMEEITAAFGEIEKNGKIRNPDSNLRVIQQRSSFIFALNRGSHF